MGIMWGVLTAVDGGGRAGWEAAGLNESCNDKRGETPITIVTSISVPDDRRKKKRYVSISNRSETRVLCRAGGLWCQRTVQWDVFSWAGLIQTPTHLWHSCPKEGSTFRHLYVNVKHSIYKVDRCVCLCFKVVPRVSLEDWTQLARQRIQAKLGRKINTWPRTT